MEKAALFHGKRIDTGEWVEGYYVSQGNDSYIFEQSEVNKGIDLGGYLDCCQMTQVIPSTVGRYTGLEDKKGEKIFDGDIVKTKTGRKCVVSWLCSPSFCGWDLKPVDTIENVLRTECPPSHDLYLKNNLEIVGSIHENEEI